MDWFLSGSSQQKKAEENKLPWYLTLKEGEWNGPKPDFVVCSATDAVPACLSVAKNNPFTYSGKITITKKEGFLYIFQIIYILMSYFL